MAMSRSTKGLIFIVAGAVLFLWAGGVWLAVALGALLLINYGLYLCKLPPLWVIVQQLLDDLRA